MEYSVHYLVRKSPLFLLVLSRMRPVTTSDFTTEIYIYNYIAQVITLHVQCVVLCVFLYWDFVTKNNNRFLLHLTKVTGQWPDDRRSILEKECPLRCPDWLS